MTDDKVLTDDCQVQKKSSAGKYELVASFSDKICIYGEKQLPHNFLFIEK